MQYDDVLVDRLEARIRVAGRILCDPVDWCWYGHPVVDQGVDEQTIIWNRFVIISVLACGLKVMLIHF